MISIISVVNKEEVLKRGLEKSLKEQSNSDYEFIKVNNTKGQYAKMKDALDYGISQARGEWIYIIHPDVYFLDKNELQRIIHQIEEISLIDPDIEIFGVAGAIPGEQRGIVSTIVHGEEKTGGRKESFEGKRYQYVQTVDACCFMIRKRTIEKYGFWDRLNGYHMYIEELCLRLRENGKRIAVIPANIWHFSAGASLDYTYYRETKKVVRRYSFLKYINTTSFQWKITKGLSIRLNYYMIRNYVHHKIVKR